MSIPDLDLPGRPKVDNRGQAEFTKTAADYLSKPYLEKLGGQGRAFLKDHEAALKRIEKITGVDRYTLVAIWGRETAYGSYHPPKDAVRMLATLAYTGKRKEKFRVELIAALKMLQMGVPRSDMKSSWAGAMGLTQAMPTEYLKYATDGDGDGKIDIAVGKYAGGLAVLLGNGDGTFQSPVNYSMGIPFSIAVGDLNADGKPDLAAASSANITVMLGNGDGTFASAINYTAGLNSRSVDIGDVNGDGKEDLVTANNSSNDASVLPGNGNGTFASATTYAVGTGPQAVAIADFNGDGMPDLATANSSGNSVSFLFQTAVPRSSIFSAAANSNVGTSPYSEAAGDFNADGKLDTILRVGHQCGICRERRNGNGRTAGAGAGQHEKQGSGGKHRRHRRRASGS